VIDNRQRTSNSIPIKGERSSSVTRISADALLYHAAACLLQAGLERLRGSGDEGLLRRIGTVFARITGGAYSGVLADEDDKGTPYLIAIEADATTTKRVEHSRKARAISSSSPCAL
jgi:hypothetical protein